MLKIGLTGGIGSGKTTVANLFKELGAPIVDADNIAKELTLTNSKVIAQIIGYFGDSIKNDEGGINRPSLRQLIFNDKKKRQWLENLLHPLIIAEMKKIAYQFSYPYCIFVIPLLSESKHINFIDRVCVVDAPVGLQTRRAKKRDAASVKHIQAIIQAQHNRDRRLQIADDIITNDHDLAHLMHQVDELHHKYLSLSTMR